MDSSGRFGEGHAEVSSHGQVYMQLGWRWTSENLQQPPSTHTLQGDAASFASSSSSACVLRRRGWLHFQQVLRSAVIWSLICLNNAGRWLIFTVPVQLLDCLLFNNVWIVKVFYISVPALEFQHSNSGKQHKTQCRTSTAAARAPIKIYRGDKKLKHVTKDSIHLLKPA